MSISPVGGVSPQPAAYDSSPVAGRGREGEPKNASQEELTTVTTHCDKDHKHTQSCPHTVTTRPAPRAGEPGSILDQRV